MIRPLLSALSLLVALPLQAAQAEPAPLFDFVSPGPTASVATDHAELADGAAETTALGEALRRVTFAAGDAASLRLTPPSGSWDWSQASALSLRLQSAMDWALTLDVKIESADGQVLSSRIALPSGPAQELLVPLQATTPRSQGMRAAPPMPWSAGEQRTLLATWVDGQLDRSQVVAVTLSLDHPNAPQSLLLGRFGVRSETDLQQAAYAGIVDDYGQFSRGQWPEKIASDTQLREAAVAENLQLQRWLGERPRTDRFGGLLDGPTFTASGFFRTEKRDGRWYLVTPSGQAFYSLGVNALSAGQSATYVEGREAMFTALPEPGSALAAYYGVGDSRRGTGASRDLGFAHGRWFDFYRANLRRSYGAPACGQAQDCNFDAPRWTTHTLERLKAWGFNTIGNWSDASLVAARRVPYTLPLLINGNFATVSTGLDLWGSMPDPFDPRFAEATERAVQDASAGHADDPWLIGYFADNELAWVGIGEPLRARYALALGSLRLGGESPAKRAFVGQLRSRYPDAPALAAAWGIELADWSVLEAAGFEAPLPDAGHPAIEEDLLRFQRLYADTYFRIVAEKLEAQAPNHLLLGGRFAGTIPEAVDACARYCDVLSFNFYTREPQHGYDFAVLRALDKPLMITEFHFGSRDRGPFWGGLQEVWTEEQRGPAYAHYLARALDEPNIVGLHWFQYIDQPITGRLLDGENGHLGLVAITDRPYQGFVEAVRQANLKVAERLATSAAASR
ncbi:beta-agarase [Pseudomonas sp. GCM10022188]|uniref:beta-agarase n=1 Tax=Pseudomonas TaxID=286 RepID=UPI001E521F91|nr:beta-agarase [Pseudomonas oryzagri]MCC6074090.1 beta-agarase [Pseudomonas oryzagri]